MASTVTKVFGGLGDVLPKAYADDSNFKKIYELSQQSRDSLSEKEKTLCRNFTVVDNILMYTPVGIERNKAATHMHTVHGRQWHATYSFLRSTRERVARGN